MYCSSTTSTVFHLSMSWKQGPFTHFSQIWAVFQFEGPKNTHDPIRSFRIPGLNLPGIKFSVSQLTAQSIVATLNSLAFQPPYIFCSTHSNHKFDSYLLFKFKHAMSAIYIVMVLLSILRVAWFYFSRKQVASLFTPTWRVWLLRQNWHRSYQ